MIKIQFFLPSYNPFKVKDHVKRNVRLDIVSNRENLTKLQQRRF